MAIVSGHDCADDRSRIDGNKEEPIINLALPINDKIRIVMRRPITERRLP